MNCSQEHTVFFRASANPVLHLFVEQGEDTGVPATGLGISDIRRATFLAPNQHTPITLGLAGEPGYTTAAGNTCGFGEVDAELLPGLYAIELSRDLLWPGYNYLYLDFGGGLDIYLPVNCVDYDASEPYAMALINWAQSSCNDHLTSGLRRSMPSVLRPLIADIRARSQGN